MMRVLFVEYTSLIGGGQRSLLELMKALHPSTTIVLACPEGPLADAAHEAGIQVAPIPESQITFKLDRRETPSALGRAGAAALAIRRVVSRFRPDVIHANSVRAGLIASAVLRGGVPLVMHCRDVLPQHAIAGPVRRLLMTRVDAVIGISRYVAESFAGPSWQELGVEVIDNPVDTTRFDPARIDAEGARRALGLDGGGPTLGMIAQITPWKGQHRAIELLAAAMKDHPDARLLLAGEPKFVSRATRHDNLGYALELRALCTQLDVQGAVHFLGEREDAERIIAVLDVLLVPSDVEPFGRTIAEAMAMNVPAITTDAGGPPEIIRPGVDGLTVDPDDASAWLLALERVLDPRFPRFSRGYAIDRFSPGVHAATVKRLYERLR